MEDSKTRSTVLNARGIFGAVHCSICYCNDKPNTINFTQYREGENDGLAYHSISLYKDDLKALVNMLKDHEMI